MSLIILIITHLNILCFSSILIFADFTFIIIDVGVLIVSFQTSEVTEFEDSQLTVSLEIEIEISIKYDRFK